MNPIRLSWRNLCTLILAAIAPCLPALAASLELPPVPYNDVDGLVTVTWGPYPGLGIPPESSLFTIDIQPAGGPNNSPLPPIAPGRYAAWCFDAATDIAPADSGTLYGGYLFSTTDPLAGFNAYLPNHPGVIRDAATWKKINYLINHRRSAYAGFVPTMWEVQNVIYLLVGQTPPSVADGYPPVRSAVVQAVLDATNTQAPSWELGCDDKVAVIFNIDVNWDAQQPDVQLLFLEVPASCTSIGNFVWNDTNANGKQDAGEPGIPGVTVELHRCIDDLLVGTTTTDANGLYLFSGFPPGDYHIKVIAPAGYTFTTANAAGTTNENDSDANASGIMPCTTLSAGENDLSWDAGLFQPVTIGNFVWNDLNWNGVQDAGEPGIPGVTLTLSGTTGGGAPVSQTTITNASGFYKFTELPGTYVVSVAPPAGYSATATGAGTTATDSNPSPSGTTPAALPGGGSDQTIDFGFTQPVTIGNFVWNDLNGNGVQDAGEPGLPGVTLTLTGTTVAGVNITRTTTTDASGIYGFVVPPGTYNVTVSPPPGFIASVQGHGTPATDSNASPSGTTPSTLTAGGSDQTLDFGFYLPVTIGNFVWNDLNGNGVQDGGEPGIPGVTLTLTGTSNGGAAIIQTTTTDSFGNYGFVAPPGAYTVTVTPPSGYTPSPLGKGTLATDSNPSPSTTSPAVLNGGGSDQTIDFGFYLPVTIGNFVWNDLNRNGVQDTGEPGIPGVAVTLTGTTGAGTPVVELQITDASGNYSFTEAPGTYSVMVTTPAGFVPTVTGAGTSATDSNPTPSGTTPGALPGGASDSTIDFGFYRPPAVALALDKTVRVDAIDCPTGPIGGGNDAPNVAGIQLLPGMDLGKLTRFLLFFGNGATDLNWQGATKGFAGDVALDGLTANERTSGSVPFAGTIYTNASTLGAWQSIVNQNAGQAFAQTGQTALISELKASLVNAIKQINLMAVTPGFEHVASTSLNGLNTQNGRNETYVINITSGLSVSSQIKITGDPGDVFILRWDTDANPSNGFQGQVKFQSGGAIVPLGGLQAGNFINVAGDMNASGGGSTPASPYPQGPRLDDGTGALVNGGNNFSGGGFFTGYWLSTGKPTTLDAASGLYVGETSPFSNALFVGGWYTLSSKVSMTSGTSGVLVCANPATLHDVTLGTDTPFAAGNVGGKTASAGTGDQLTFTYKVTNTGGVPVAGVSVSDDNATPGNAADDFAPVAVQKTNGRNVGDANDNGVLDPGESWYFQAKEIASSAGSFTNTATTTSGSAGAISSATYVISAH